MLAQVKREHKDYLIRARRLFVGLSISSSPGCAIYARSISVLFAEDYAANIESSPYTFQGTLGPHFHYTRVLTHPRHPSEGYREQKPRARAEVCFFFSLEQRSLSFVFRGKNAAKKAQNLSSLLHLSSPFFFRARTQDAAKCTRVSRVYEGEDCRYISLRVVFSARCFRDEKFIVRLCMYIYTVFYFFYTAYALFPAHLSASLRALFSLSLSLSRSEKFFLYMSADSLIITLL